MKTFGTITTAALLLCATTTHASVAFEFTPGPGLTALSTTDPVKAAGIMAGVSSAASKWSSLISDPVTLKYKIDYDPSLPALGAAFDVYMAAPYAGVKPALIGKASSAFDATATSSLQSGPSLKLWTNDLFAGPSFPPSIDDDGSVNNVIMDVSRAHMKGLGILPADDGAPGADGTLKFGSASFDFDPTDGIDSGKYDLVGVAMHEIAHSMGFISGVDTLSTLVPSPIFGPPGPVHATPMVTVLDLFRYSSDSLSAGLFVPDLSLPVPAELGFSHTRYFSIDGGATPMGLFSTGTALAGDGSQAGHWAMDPTFGLMDPALAPGFALTDTFMDLTTGPPTADLIALDVIGWTIAPAVPEPASLSLLAVVAGAFVARRRKGS